MTVWMTKATASFRGGRKEKRWEDFRVFEPNTFLPFSLDDGNVS